MTGAEKQDAERRREFAAHADEFAAATDEEALLRLVARRLSEVYGALCVIRPLSEDRLYLEASVAVHHPDPLVLARARSASATRQRVGEGFIGGVAASGEASFLPVVRAAQLLATLAPEHQEAVSSLMAAPLVAQGQVFGVISLSRSEPASPFEELELRHLRDMGTYFAMAVANSRAAAAAQKTQALLAAIVNSSDDAIVSKRLDGTITSWNSAAERLFGYAPAEAVGRHITMLMPPDRLDEEGAFIEKLAAGGRIEHYETVRRRKDGSEVSVSISLAPIRDASGDVVGVSKIARDLTNQQKAAEELRRTEEQLRHAQKMEAVGRLAGGIAHDFNNILCVILSCSEFVLGDLKPEDQSREDVEEIRKAAGRAAELTRQLLLFSRQQIVEPRVLDLNEVVVGMDKMVRRLLGADIELVSLPGPNLNRVLVDPSSVEQVIMNLVVNGRDAMPTGGKLTIETRNVVLDDEYARAHLGSRPGAHVMLAVTDNGVGMDEATQARIFEPFFTTKGPSKGTGLGLSTVFGIVQQCGGTVWVYSELGRGSTFKVYLPRVEADSQFPESVPAPITLRGSEVILLAEDQEQVRAVARGILERNGYRVLVAGSPEDALRMSLEEQGAIHLLLTDVVMPRMSGVELSRRIGAARPEVKVLYMSGYTDDTIVRNGVLESGIAFLQKPFTPASLTRKVREVLDAPAGARGSLKP